MQANFHLKIEKLKEYVALNYEIICNYFCMQRLTAGEVHVFRVYRKKNANIRMLKRRKKKCWRKCVKWSNINAVRISYNECESSVDSFRVQDAPKTNRENTKEKQQRQHKLNTRHYEQSVYKVPIVCYRMGFVHEPM